VINFYIFNVSHPVRPIQQGNKIFSALTAQDWWRWLDQIELVELKVDEVLFETRHTITHVYFPTSCIIAEHYDYEDGSTAEFGQVGNEGMAGVFAFMGSQSAHSKSIVVVEGLSYRIETKFLLNEFSQSSELRKLILRYMQTLMAQSAHAASCNRRHTIDQQLARFLLINLDRIQGHRLSFTHEAMAQTMGVRREGVSNAAKKLQMAGWIEYTRGHIDILNRHALEHTTC
jgi:CRP-like cAMP-binding protein